MPLGSELYNKISNIGSLRELDAAAFDLSFELQLKSHALCELEYENAIEADGPVLSMIGGRADTFNKALFFDQQMEVISAQLQNPIASLSPHLWNETENRWVQTNLHNGLVDLAKPSLINLALFVPVVPTKVICLFAIGVRMERRRNEMVFFHSIASLIVAKRILLAQPADKEFLTETERRCLVYAANGKTNGEIATSLSLSEHAVDLCLSSTCLKLGVKNQSHAIARAIKLGLVGGHEFA